SRTPTFSLPPWARTMAGAAITVVTAAAPANRCRRFNVVDALRVLDMAHSPGWTLAFMVVVHGPGRQASRLRLWSIAKALFDCCGDVEQAPVLAVAGDQHQTGREAILPRQRQRDRAKVEEIDGIGVAQQQRILAAKLVGFSNLRDPGRNDRRRRQHQRVEFAHTRVHRLHQLPARLSHFDVVIGRHGAAPLDANAYERIDTRDTGGARY